MNSLGIDKAPSRTRVVVGMSGGVDSAVTAGLLASQGYEVVGVTLQLYDHGVAIGRKGACCAGQDIYDARQVAEKLGIAHYVLDYESRFRQSVIDEFVDSYVAGETPVPCIRCNQTVKFTDLLGTARELGADALATGHYVRRVMGPNGPELHRAVDASRDQSYFLFATTREQLDFLRFPLGEQSKVETRAMAERLGLEIAAKPDSQDICFVPEGSYAALVEKLRPGALEAGDIVDEAGHVLGRHDGIINFTVGQRRGLGVGGTAEPLFVLKLDPEQKRVIVGPRASLARQEVYLRETSWLDSALVPGAERRIQVKLRSAQPPLPGLLRVGEGGLATILLDEPVLGVAPGQAGAVYEEARVLGGGWLTRAQPQPRALSA